MADPRPLHATVEDYTSSDDDDSGVVTESFNRRASPASANVAAKRSKSSEMGAVKDKTDKAPESLKEERLPSNIDLQSDSGYSSHTAATMSSADSAPSAKSQSPPVAPAQPHPQSQSQSHPQEAPPPSPTLKRRGTLSSRKRDIVLEERESPRKPLGRSGSVSSRQQPRDRERERRSTRGQADAEPECNVPNCTKCGPNATASRGRPARPPPTPLSAGAHDTQSRVSSDPSTYYVPASPSHSRQPSYYAQGSAIVQPGISRRSSSATRGARPLSYHGEPGQGYPGWQMPNQLPSPPQEMPNRGPPPAGSAYYSMQNNPQMHHYGVTGATPPSNGFYGHPAHPSHPFYSPPYDVPQHPSRPPLAHQNSSYSARGPQGISSRPLSQYNTVITQDLERAGDRPKGPSARYHDPPPQPTASRSRFEEDSSSEYESSSEEDYEEDRRSRARDKRLMPPPEFKPRSRGDGEMSQSMVLPERPRERDPKASRVSTTTTSSRAPSKTRRPAILQNKAQTAYEVPTRNSNRNSQIYVENPVSARRQSYVGYEDQNELKKMHRNSKVYYPDSQPEPKPRRRPTQSERDVPSQRREEELADKFQSVESYMAQQRGSDGPLNDRVHAKAKRLSTRISNPSDAGSRRSRHSDDNKSRVSRATNATTNGAGEIRLKLDIMSTPLNLEINGDMEGRTLQINPTEGGMAELVIGSRETAYRSERGSVAGSDGKRKLIANNARRDAEERSSVRSVNSSSRRERDRESRIDPRDRESRIDARDREVERERRRRAQQGTFYDDRSSGI